MVDYFFLFISLQKKDMFETVKNRRTIRKYLPKDINPSLLNDLLETSFRASTMGGMQLYSVIAVSYTHLDVYKRQLLNWYVVRTTVQGKIHE